MHMHMHIGSCAACTRTCACTCTCNMYMHMYMSMSMYMCMYRALLAVVHHGDGPWLRVAVGVGMSGVGSVVSVVVLYN